MAIFLKRRTIADSEICYANKSDAALDHNDSTVKRDGFSSVCPMKKRTNLTVMLSATCILF